MEKIKKIPKDKIEKYITVDDWDDPIFENEDFADATNRLFPINNQTNIEKTIEVLTKTKLDEMYSKAEQFYIWNRVIQAADANEYEIADFIKENLKNLKGVNNKMEEKDFTKTEEFTKAVEAGVKSELEKNKTVAELESIKKDMVEAQKSIEDLNKENEDLTGKLATTEEEYKNYKLDQEKVTIANTRMAELNEIGMSFANEESKKFMFDFVKELNEPKYKNLKEVFITNKAEKKPEEKKLEEAKAAKKNLVDKSKAEGAIPNDVNNANGEDKYSFVISALKKNKQLILTR